MKAQSLFRLLLLLYPPGFRRQFGQEMRAFVDAGYDGYVGHEWIATGDAVRQLSAAIEICDA